MIDSSLRIVAREISELRLTAQVKDITSGCKISALHELGDCCDEDLMYTSFKDLLAPNTIATKHPKDANAIQCVTVKPSPDDGWIFVQYSKPAKSIVVGEGALSIKQLRKRQIMIKDSIDLLKAKNSLRWDDFEAALQRAIAEYRRLGDQAADATFRKFNPHGEQHGKLDLHHLSVYEAKVKLVEHLPATAAAVRERNKTRGGGSRWVLVVTGAGTHSVGSPKLEEAVQGWLVGLGVRVRPRDRGCWRRTR
jgi:DNA-nicking Smr family endonuclease